MEEMDNKEKSQREEIFSKAVRAGKRTYFFDVKSTKAEEYYLTITESKKRFLNDEGKFHYEKHKIFLYKEDFEKFVEGMTDVIDFIKTGKPPVSVTPETPSNEFTDVSFDDLKETSENEEEK
ncbi:MAG: DUF3276 family protein [Bacteroidales bacterium]|jgi:hypothetical protein